MLKVQTVETIPHMNYESMTRFVSFKHIFLLKNEIFICLFVCEPKIYILHNHKGVFSHVFNCSPYESSHTDHVVNR